MHICNEKYNRVLRDITYCCNIDTTDAKLLMNSYGLCTMPNFQTWEEERTSALTEYYA